MSAGQYQYTSDLGNEELRLRQGVATLKPNSTMQTIRVTAVRTPQQMQAAQSDVVLVADGTGSIAGRKLADEIAAQEAFALLKARLDPDGRIALIVFREHAREVLGLTPARDSKTIGASIRSLTAEGDTNITAGLEAAGVLLARERTMKPRFAVLLSDGYHNRGSDPVAASEVLKRAGVVIYTVGLGADPSDVDPRLPAIASAADKYVFLRDKDSLVKHFEFVSRQTSIRSRRA